MTIALSTMEYPHWLMLAGALLVMLGLAGIVLRPRTVEAETVAIASEQEPSELAAELDQVEVYNRTAKQKRRDRWAEGAGDSKEPLNSSTELGQGLK
jgi:hypothetical protein